MKIADLPQKHLNHIILTVDKFLCLAPYTRKKIELVFTELYLKIYGICTGYVWDMYGEYLGLCDGETRRWGDKEMGRFFNKENNYFGI